MSNGLRAQHAVGSLQRLPLVSECRRSIAASRRLEVREVWLPHPRSPDPPADVVHQGLRIWLSSVTHRPQGRTLLRDRATPARPRFLTSDLPRIAVRGASLGLMKCSSALAARHSQS